MKLITDNLQRLRELCEKYKVSKLYVFGSILTDRFNEDSDVDFSVYFNAKEINDNKVDWAEIFFGFIEELETLLGRKVDLIDERYIRNKYFRQQLDDTKRLIYAS